MQKMKTLLVLGVLIAAAAAVQNSDLIADATLKLEKGLRQPGKNFFISGSSIQIAMAMIYLGAKSNTASQVAKGLGFGGVTNIHAEEKKLLDCYGVAGKNYTVDIANRLFIQEKFNILDGYKTNVANYYYAPVELVNFVNSAATAKLINDWVASKTGNMIKDFFSSDSFNGDTVMVLANAIYFRGVWVTQFPAAITDKFYPEGSSPVDTSFMRLQNQKFAYRDLTNLNSQLLVLPYVGDSVRMVVLLPNEGIKINDVLNKLDSATILSSCDKMTPIKINKLDFPKFKFESTFLSELKTVLEATFGIKDLFDSGLSNLTGITTQGQLYISKIQHKAVIEVDEQGTKAAAATGAVGMIKSMPMNPIPIDFIANRPFAFWIADCSCEKTVLFFGVYKTPPQ